MQVSLCLPYLLHLGVLFCETFTPGVTLFALHSAMKTDKTATEILAVTRVNPQTLL